MYRDRGSAWVGAAVPVAGAGALLRDRWPLLGGSLLAILLFGGGNQVLGALQAASSDMRMADYDRTLRSRGYDLRRYWSRLPMRGKLGLLAEGVKRGVFR